MTLARLNIPDGRLVLRDVTDAAAIDVEPDLITTTPPLGVAQMGADWLLSIGYPRDTVALLIPLLRHLIESRRREWQFELREVGGPICAFPCRAVFRRDGLLTCSNHAEF